MGLFMRLHVEVGLSYEESEFENPTVKGFAYQNSAVALASRGGGPRTVPLWLYWAISGTVPASSS